MSRTIKFRGKRIDNGEWVYGFPLITEIDSFILKEIIIQVAPNTPNGLAEFDLDIDYIKVDLATVGEFTGLLDKNGKDLDWYEGDLFDIFGQEFVIEFFEGSFWFIRNNSDKFDRLLCQETIRWGKDIPKKIGNIHENAELLESKP